MLQKITSQMHIAQAKQTDGQRNEQVTDAGEKSDAFEQAFAE